MQFIDQHIENGQNVLIHCKAGHKRSVCLVAYYLMKKYGVSREVALEYIRRIRPTIFNNKNKMYFYNSLK